MIFSWMLFHWVENSMGFDYRIIADACEDSKIVLTVDRV